MTDPLLRDKTVQATLSSFATDLKKPIDEFYREAKKILKEMKADLNYLWIKFWSIILRWFFHHIYEGYSLNFSEFEKIKKIAGKHPLFLVPSHRSHVDYLLLSYIFYQEKLPVPMIAAGKNLSFWPMRYIFRKSGAYFIRRSFGKDKFYRFIVKSYVQSLIQQKLPQEFFIEGTRSRSGKLGAPQIGLLSIFIECFLEKGFEDFYFVPIAINYEKVLEDCSYIQEIHGTPKKKESLWNLFTLKKYLKRKSGKIYVSFGEPISLKEYLAGRTNDEGKKLTLGFADQLIHSIGELSQITASSLVATVLLEEPHSKQTESILFQKIENLIKEFKLKKIKFCEPLEKNWKKVVQKSISRYLSEGVIQKSQENSETIYQINSSQQTILEYYKNDLLHHLKSTSSPSTPLQIAHNDLNQPH